MVVIKKLRNVKKIGTIKKPLFNYWVKGKKERISMSLNIK